MRIVEIALMLSLAGCGASSSIIGPRTYQVTCRRSQANCWEEAQRVCPGGFTQLDGADHSNYVVTGGAVVQAYKGEMIIRCTGDAPVVAQAAATEPAPASRPRDVRKQPPRR